MILCVSTFPTLPFSYLFSLYSYVLGTLAFSVPHPHLHPHPHQKKRSWIPFHFPLIIINCIYSLLKCKVSESREYVCLIPHYTLCPYYTLVDTK